MRSSRRRVKFSAFLGCTPDMEEDLRLPPAAVPLGQQRRSPVRHPAPWSGRVEHRSRSRNQAWLELALSGIDLACWMRALLLDGDLALAEPKKLRYCLLHVAARITRSARRTRLRIAEHWPWAKDLATAFERLAQLPRRLIS